MKKKTQSSIIDTIQLLKDKYDFLNLENENNDNVGNMAKKEEYLEEYYSNLYKEFCIGDLSQYKKGKIGLRWCTEKDIIEGKGYKICGNTSCNRTKKLKPFEVNMQYKQENTHEIKNALVKLYLCRHCAKKLKKMNDYKKEFQKKQLQKK